MVYNKKGFVISALSSKQGKTLFTMALLYKLNKGYKIKPFKIGPDYIDPLFHKKICRINSVNLDLYMMNENQLKYIFNKYLNDRDIAVIEGVMGYYDGIEKNTSTYDIAKTLNIPAMLLISAEGSYSTIPAILKGILTYKNDNTIKGIVLNHISSENHFNMIKTIIEKEFAKIKILGWIKKDIKILPSRHLGLDLRSLNDINLEAISEEVLEHIDLDKLLNIADININNSNATYPFTKLNDDTINKLKTKNITIVNDSAFSFLYEDNVNYLQEIFNEVNIISALNNNKIPNNTNVVYIPGGYVETAEVYEKLSIANDFKNSLISFSNNTDNMIYAECAGLMYLGKSVYTIDNEKLDMSGILPITFSMQNSRKRLGYYTAYDINTNDLYKGHSFHYSDTTITDDIESKWALFKDNSLKAEIGCWGNGKNVIGTYLHTFLRMNPKIIENYFAG